MVPKTDNRYKKYLKFKKLNRFSPDECWSLVKAFKLMSTESISMAPTSEQKTVMRLEIRSVTKMPHSRTLTYATLVSSGACQEALEKFKEMFGGSVEVTEDLCISVVGTFDYWIWASRHLLTPLGKEKFIDYTAYARDIKRMAVFSGDKDAERNYNLVKARTFARYYITNGI